jgi:hypothetical protein
MCVSVSLEKKMMPREQEAQWWLSNVLFLFLRENPEQYCLSLRKRRVTSAPPYEACMIYVSFSLRERGGLVEYLVYSPRFIYVFQQLKTSFLLCLIEGGCVFTQFCLWLGLVYLLLRLYFWLSLELVLWYCNNFYSNSILFEVRNVVTSLLGLVIVSHLSPKGSGRFTNVAATIY